MAEPAEKWFNAPKGSNELSRLVSLAEQVVPRFKDFLVEAELSNILKKGPRTIAYSALTSILNEADTAVKTEMGFIRPNLDGLRPLSFRGRRPLWSPSNPLKDFGLSTKSLRVKLGIIERYWKQLREVVKQSGTTLAAGIKELAPPVMKALEHFFRYLKEFLSSLACLFPSIEAAKELVDAILASIDLYRGAKELAQGI